MKPSKLLIVVALLLLLGGRLILLQRRAAVHAAWAEPEWRATPGGYHVRRLTLTSEAPFLFSIDRHKEKSGLWVSWHRVPKLPGQSYARPHSIDVDGSDYMEVTPDVRMELNLSWPDNDTSRALDVEVYRGTVADLNASMEFRTKHPWLRWLRPMPKYEEITLP
jgi:hypothetical protein